MRAYYIQESLTGRQVYFRYNKKRMGDSFHLTTLKLYEVVKHNAGHNIAFIIDDEGDKIRIALATPDLYKGLLLTWILKREEEETKSNG